MVYIWKVFLSGNFCLHKLWSYIGRKESSAHPGFLVYKNWVELATFTEWKTTLKFFVCLFIWQLLHN